MSTEPFIGEIKILGFNWAPQGYQLCQGQTMAISTNTALFSLIGTTYGGDGVQTFKLPDLQGRTPLGQGSGSGLKPHSIGEQAGIESVTLLSSNMPQHAHTLGAASVKLLASTANAAESSPDGGFPGATASPIYADSSTPNTFTGGAVVSGTTDIAGGSAPFSVLNPYLVMNYSIAIYGIFPSRP